MIRIVICWPQLVGYMTACFRALAAQPGVELLVVAGHGGANVNAPFDPSIAAGLNIRLLRPDERDEQTIAQIVTEFRPHVVSLPGWGTPAYRQLAFNPSLAQAKFVMVMDTPRNDNLRQQFGKYRFGKYFSRISRVATAGERAFQCAKVLGFKESQILRGGMLGFDYDLFSPAYEERVSLPSWPRRFLYCGRYHDVKAIDVLLEAYSLYRTTTPEPWPLTTCGAGPWESAINATPGVNNLGFVQPANQAGVYAAHGVFLLASRFEPWALVIAEACAAGLPVICTEACGAAVELVRSHYNGLTVATDDAHAFARALRYMHEHHDKLAAMGRRGMALAAPFSAHIWASRWRAMLDELCQTQELNRDKVPSLPRQTPRPQGVATTG